MSYTIKNPLLQRLCLEYRVWKTRAAEQFRPVKREEVSHSLTWAESFAVVFGSFHPFEAHERAMMS